MDSIRKLTQTPKFLSIYKSVIYILHSLCLILFLFNPISFHGKEVNLLYLADIFKLDVPQVYIDLAFQWVFIGLIYLLIVVLCVVDLIKSIGINKKTERSDFYYKDEYQITGVSFNLFATSVKMFFFCFLAKAISKFTDFSLSLYFIIAIGITVLLVSSFTLDVMGRYNNSSIFKNLLIKLLYILILTYFIFSIGAGDLAELSWNLKMFGTPVSIFYVISNILQNALVITAFSYILTLNQINKKVLVKKNAKEALIFSLIISVAICVLNYLSGDSISLIISEFLKKYLPFNTAVIAFWILANTPLSRELISSAENDFELTDKESGKSIDDFSQERVTDHLPIAQDKTKRYSLYLKERINIEDVKKNTKNKFMLPRELMNYRFLIEEIANIAGVSKKEAAIIVQNGTAIKENLTYWEGEILIKDLMSYDAVAILKENE